MSTHEMILGVCVVVVINIDSWRQNDHVLFLLRWCGVSLGKGLAAAALGANLEARGYKVRLRKLDPYLMWIWDHESTQHGEVYVTDDGAETDLDLSHYEIHEGDVPSLDNVTAGRIYKTVLEKSGVRLSWGDRSGYSPCHRSD